MTELAMAGQLSVLRCLLYRSKQCTPMRWWQRVAEQGGRPSPFLDALDRFCACAGPHFAFCLDLGSPVVAPLAHKGARPVRAPVAHVQMRQCL